MGQIYAHSLPGQPLELWETLPEHSQAAASLAELFAAPFGGAGMAQAAGLLHDIGKLSPEFQAYIQGDRQSGGDHSTAGARLAIDIYGERFGGLLAAIVAGHHAGLADPGRLAERLAAPAPFGRRAFEAAIGPAPELAALTPNRRLDFRAGPKGFAGSVLLRMLFSCLVDADFLATEAFYARASGDDLGRGRHLAIPELRDRLARHMAGKRAGASGGGLGGLRNAVLDHALAKAAAAPGLFTLTVPTGGGKTLASLSFALEHAVRHDLKRVIYVIPHGSADRNSTALSAPADGTCRSLTGARIETRPSARRPGTAPRRALAGARIETPAHGQLERAFRVSQLWSVERPSSELKGIRSSKSSISSPSITREAHAAGRD